MSDDKDKNRKGPFDMEGFDEFLREIDIDSLGEPPKPDESNGNPELVSNPHALTINQVPREEALARMERAKSQFYETLELQRIYIEAAVQHVRDCPNPHPIHDLEAIIASAHHAWLERARHSERLGEIENTAAQANELLQNISLDRPITPDKARRIVDAIRQIVEEED